MVVQQNPGVSSRRSGSETREHILGVAADLFYRDGIRATGVDKVASCAAVAPPTLYRLFSSKDELVAAYVERCAAAYRERLSAATGGPDSPRERILAVFDVFADEALSAACRGCPFMLVLAEFPDSGHPGHRAAVAHKQWVRELLHGLVAEHARERPVSDPLRVSDHLTLIAEGIYASVQTLGPSGPALHGRHCVEALLDREDP